MKQDIQMMRAAYDAWVAAADFRSRRDRLKRFTFGDQWSDYVEDPDGNRMTEREALRLKGRRPLTNNLIRQQVKTIVGRFRSMAADSGRYDLTPGSDDDRNCLADLDARMLEEFVISGCAAQRIVAETRPGGSGVWIDNVNPRRLFVNRYTDPRGLDIQLIGMLHDMTLPEIINRFGSGSSARADALSTLFADSAGDRVFSHPWAPLALADGLDFFNAGDGRHRLIELWTLDARKVRERGRLHMRFVWHCRWLAPDATVIDEYDSPFAHAAHPFVIKLYPLTDGEVHSFVEDIVDQQRAINRQVVLIDAMLAHAAKGTLLFPVRRLADGVSLDDVNRMWAAPDSVIPIDGHGPLPVQVVTRTADSGAYQALNLHMQMLKEVSGINDALMGQNVSPATGSQLYQAQVSNQAVALVDLLDSFAAFALERDRKFKNTIKKC